MIGGMRRLSEHDLVVLSLPREETRVRSTALRFRVIAIFGTTAALHPLDPDEIRRIPAEVEGAFMTFRHNGGVVGLQGSVERHDDHLRFRVSDGVMVPRRTSTRVEVEAPVTFRREGDQEVGNGVTRNVGVDGILIESGAAVTAGEALELTLALPGAEAELKVGAQVSRTSGDGFAIIYTTVSPEIRKQLGTFVFERSLEDLRRHTLAAAGARDDFAF